MATNTKTVVTTSPAKGSGATAHGTDGHGHGHTHGHSGTRRDFLTVTALGFAGTGAAVSLWPFIQQMNPDSGAQAAASTEIDLSQIKEGQAITVMWRGKPVFIRNRTKKEIEEARAVSIKERDVKDKAQAEDAARVKKGKENWLVLVGICTHLGCIPKGTSMADAKGDYNGWFCPCHGSHYDTSGRIRKGPAPKNLEVPPYEFVSDTKIKIG